MVDGEAVPAHKLILYKTADFFKIYFDFYSHATSFNTEFQPSGEEKKQEIELNGYELFWSSLCSCPLSRYSFLLNCLYLFF